MAAAVCTLPPPAGAQSIPTLAMETAVNPVAATDTPDGAMASERLLDPLWAGRARMVDRGIDISLGYIGEVLGNVDGGIKRGAVYEGLVKGALDLDLARLVSAPGTKLHACALFPHGPSLSERYVGDLFALSNIDATDDVRLFEAWLEQPLGTESLTLRFGILAVDEEFAFTDQGGLFLNSAFGWPSTHGANVPAPVYPQGALGGRIAWHPTESTFLQAAICDGDPNPVDSSGDPTNPHGVRFSLDEGALIILEGGVSWNQAPDTALPGTAKLGLWYHTGEFDHLRLDNTGLSLADPASSGVPENLDGDYGMYVTVEQSLWREAEDASQSLGVFTRLGLLPRDRNPLPFHAELGVTRTGLIPGRDSDVGGLAVVCGGLSREARRLVEDTNAAAGTSTPLPDYELAFEATYQWVVRPGFNLQPCLQYIVHPGGSSAIDNALVLGLRFNLDF